MGAVIEFLILFDSLEPLDFTMRPGKETIEGQINQILIFFSFSKNLCKYYSIF